MKRQRCLGCLLASCVLILTACGAVQPVSGQVVERTTEETGTLSAFVVETSTGERIGLTVTEKTRFFSWVDGVSGQDFAAGSLDGMAVSVVTGDPADLTANDGTDLPAYEASEVQITQVRLAETITLSDGTEVEIWQGSRDNRYKLSNGTELLWEQHPVGPDRVHVAGQESLDDLSPAAQEAVRAYYDAQGLLYRTYDELENAYAAYLESGRDPGFDSYLVGQETTPCASSDRVIYFLTSVTLPINGSVATEVRLGAAFDRETGEHLSPWDLFTCSEEEARQTLLDLAQPSDGTDSLRAEMEAALTPESLIFFPDHLELAFPEGTLPSQSRAFLAALDYESDLGAILQDWAIPREME